MLLAPAVRDGAQEGNQRRRAGEDHSLLKAFLHDPGVFLDCGAEERFTRQEKDDKVGRGLKLLPVPFGAQFGDVLADRLGVAREGLVSQLVGLSLGGLEEGDERNFGVHDDRPAGRKLNDHVRPQAPFLALGALLFDKVHVLDHPRELHSTAECQLPPSAPDLRHPLERRRQVTRLSL